uniref:Uncharacterized protein n=1 Tax=Oryzias melastigma TaxID=30732 RepID=A0A3B3DCM0_ORYME
MRSFLPAVAEQLFGDIQQTYHDTSQIPDDLLIALKFVFGSCALLALDLVDQRSVICLSSPSGRQAFQTEDQVLCSPQRDLDGQVSVNRNGQEAEDGALSEDQDEAGEKETAVKIQKHPDADGDGEGDGKAAHQDVRHGQRHQEVVGGVLQRAVDGDRPAHQHVPRYGENCDDNLYSDVERVHLLPVRLRSHGPAVSPRGAGGDPGLLRGWLPSDSKGLFLFKERGGRGKKVGAVSWSGAQPAVCADARRSACASLLRGLTLSENRESDPWSI